jgi:putative hydroxymethylpyrimidine transport system substrate-binding protein
MKGRTRWYASLLVLVTIAAACGDDGGEAGGPTGLTETTGTTAATGATGAPGGEPTELTVATEWPFPDPLWIPFLVARDQGFYEDAGLDVTIQPPPDNSTTMRMVDGGQAQVGLSAITDVVFAQAEDLSVISVANMTRSNNWGLFSLEEEPIDIASLEGQTIGIYNDSWTAAMLPLMLESGGLTMDDVQTVAATASVIPLLLEGEIDVATEVTNLGGVEIVTSGGSEPQVLLAPEVGAPDTPVWVYVASSDFAAENPEAVTAWLDATRQGAEWAIANPEDAVALFEEAYPDTASAHEYNLQAWEATIPLLTRDGEFFTQTEEQWTSFTQALVDAGQLDEALPAGEYFTNDFLP